ncbi:MAG: GTP 3',8-cyclase MoaA [Candidatus Omnitrophica bacterium]|nr:GTP 3',8-cyclase MoaA [Candidatus Omnitrophota bacterium]
MLTDSYGRDITYLRISVTDRCNLRCMYCMPPGGIDYKSQDEMLSFEEINRIARIAVGLGIRKLRITGGEPLIRKDITLLVKKLKSIKGVNEIALTTNGICLLEYAHELKKAGIDRVNVSLDSLIPERFEKITRGGRLAPVLEGVDASLSIGLTPLKINMVLLNGFNVDEIAAFVELTRHNPIEVRFIEYMPTRLGLNFRHNLFFSADETRDICSRLGKLAPVYSEEKSAARVYRINGFLGTLGFISPISKPFCNSCNKLRLTAGGLLKGCLHSSKVVDLKKAMRGSVTNEKLRSLIKEAVATKPASHNLSISPLGWDSENFSMCQIGG